MKRFAVVPLLVLAAALPGLGRPTAAQTPASPTATDTAVPTVLYNGFCLGQPYNNVSDCPTVAPTRAPILPTKTLAVSAGLSQPAGTTLYQVSLTSRFVCFALNEPINVYALSANPSSTTFTVTSPYSPAGGQSVSVLPDPTTGTAQLTLEVQNATLGSAGLDVKAVWPQEGVEQIQNVVAGTEPTGTPAATATMTPATSTTATGTATAAPTATPTPPPFSLRACVDPNPVVTGTTATLYGQTTPGASCVASVTDPEGIPTGFDGSTQIAGSDGLVLYPFTVGSSTGTGTGIVQCTYNGQTLRTTTTFTIVPPGTPGPTATPTAPPNCYAIVSAGGSCLGPVANPRSGSTGNLPCPPPVLQGFTNLYVDVCVSPNPAPHNTNVTVYGRTIPGALCTASVVYSDGRSPATLDPTPRYADFQGLVSFTFYEESLASQGTATVTCTTPDGNTQQNSTQFAIG